MEGLASAISQGLNRTAANSSINDVIFEYAVNGQTGSFVYMINGVTTMDGISCSVNGVTLTITRDGANLDIENTSGVSVDVTDIGILGSDTDEYILKRTLLGTAITIPDGQVARISEISFDLAKVV
jgi:hypothetical protein